MGYNYYNKKKLPYWIVYCLPEENPPYVGKTNNPWSRMIGHRTRHKRNTEGWFALDICLTNKEARKAEILRHNEGYGGKSYTQPNTGSGIFTYSKQYKVWVAKQIVDGKRIQIKQGKDKQVVLDALNEWNKKEGRDLYQD